MANEGNLIPFDQRTESEQRAIRSKGGIASGKARREQAAFKDIFNEILNEDGGTYKGETVSKKTLIAVKALKYLLDENKLDARDFAKMFEVVRDTVGERPAEKVVLTDIDQADIDEVEAMVLGAEEENVDTGASN